MATRLREMLTLIDVARRYRVTPATIKRWFANGAMPRPITPAPGIHRWPLETLLEWERSFQTEKHESKKREPKKSAAQG